MATQFGLDNPKHVRLLEVNTRELIYLVLWILLKMCQRLPLSLQMKNKPLPA